MILRVEDNESTIDGSFMPSTQYGQIMLHLFRLQTRLENMEQQLGTHMENLTEKLQRLETMNLMMGGEKLKQDSKNINEDTAAPYFVSRDKQITTSSKKSPTSIRSCNDVKVKASIPPLQKVPSPDEHGTDVSSNPAMASGNLIPVNDDDDEKPTEVESSFVRLQKSWHKKSLQHHSFPSKSTNTTSNPFSKNVIQQTKSNAAPPAALPLPKTMSKSSHDGKKKVQSILNSVVPQKSMVVPDHEKEGGVKSSSSSSTLTPICYKPSPNSNEVQKSVERYFTWHQKKKALIQHYEKIDLKVISGNFSGDDDDTSTEKSSSTTSNTTNTTTTTAKTESNDENKETTTPNTRLPVKVPKDQKHDEKEVNGCSNRPTGARSPNGTSKKRHEVQNPFESYFASLRNKANQKGFDNQTKKNTTPQQRNSNHTRISSWNKKGNDKRATATTAGQQEATTKTTTPKDNNMKKKFTTAAFSAKQHLSAAPTTEELQKVTENSLIQFQKSLRRDYFASIKKSEQNNSKNDNNNNGNTNTSKPETDCLKVNHHSSQKKKQYELSKTISNISTSRNDKDKMKLTAAVLRGVTKAQEEYDNNKGENGQSSKITTMGPSPCKTTTTTAAAEDDNKVLKKSESTSSKFILNSQKTSFGHNREVRPGNGPRYNSDVAKKGQRKRREILPVATTSTTTSIPESRRNSTNEMKMKPKSTTAAPDRIATETKNNDKEAEEIHNRHPTVRDRRSLTVHETIEKLKLPDEKVATKTFEDIRDDNKNIHSEYHQRHTKERKFSNHVSQSVPNSKSEMSHSLPSKNSIETEVIIDTADNGGNINVTLKEKNTESTTSINEEKKLLPVQHQTTRTSSTNDDNMIKSLLRNGEGHFLWKDVESSTLHVAENDWQSCYLDCPVLTIGHIYQWTIDIVNVGRNCAGIGIISSVHTEKNFDKDYFLGSQIGGWSYDSEGDLHHNNKKVKEGLIQFGKGRITLTLDLSVGTGGILIASIIEGGRQPRQQQQIELFKNILRDGSNCGMKFNNGDGFFPAVSGIDGSDIRFVGFEKSTLERKLR